MEITSIVGPWVGRHSPPPVSSTAARAPARVSRLVFSFETKGRGAHRDAAEPAWRALREHFGLEGERRDDGARTFVGRLFRLSFAVLHAPSYQTEHKSALSSDWAHLPIPKHADLFAQLVDAGERVIRLLDANRDARDVIEAVLSPERAKQVGQLRRRDVSNVSAADLQLTVTY